MSKLKSLEFIFSTRFANSNSEEIKSFPIAKSIEQITQVNPEFDAKNILFVSPYNNLLQENELNDLVVEKFDE